jgi:DNA-binding transcriptional ArsR family regulator
VLRSPREPKDPGTATTSATGPFRWWTTANLPAVTLRGENTLLVYTEAMARVGPDQHQGDRAAVAEALRVLANPLRLEILEWLGDPDKYFADMEPIADRHELGVCVSHIQAKADLAQSTVSAFMADMRRAGLVKATRVGKWTHYRRDEESIQAFLAGLTDMVSVKSLV